ncbi:MAG: hypothetical protein ABI611_13400 [Solirubrobacteraceae bacterium]
MTQRRIREPTAQPAGATLHAARRSAPHAMLLSLQRTAGNAAVGRLLARTPQQDSVTAMKATKGYGALSAGEKTRIDTLIGGSTSVSAHAWSHMKDLLDTAATDKDAAKTFQDFVSGDTWKNFDARLPGEKLLGAAPFTKAGPTEAKAHPYRSGAADAKKTVVSITGTWPNGGTTIHEIPIFEPKVFAPPAPDRVLPSVDDMAKVLAEIPIQSRAAITARRPASEGQPGRRDLAGRPEVQPDRRRVRLAHDGGLRRDRRRVPLDRELERDRARDGADPRDRPRPLEQEVGRRHHEGEVERLARRPHRRRRLRLHLRRLLRR